MSPQEAIEFFGTKAELAKVLGIQPPSIYDWEDDGEIPLTRQYQIELASDGKLKADKPANRKAA